MFAPVYVTHNNPEIAGVGSNGSAALEAIKHCLLQERLSYLSAGAFLNEFIPQSTGVIPGLCSAISINNVTFVWEKRKKWMRPPPPLVVLMAGYIFPFLAAKKCCCSGGF
ncbi:hypothetical protein ACFH2Y_05545 [Enterobacter hormaechei]